MRGPATAVLLAIAGVAMSGQQPTFRSSIEIVSVPVSVTDRNRPVGDLAAADFELFDNDVKQDVRVTAVETMPTDVTFLIDTSGSITGRALDRIKSDVQEMAALLQPNDRARLVSFARDPTDVFGLVPGGATLDFSAMRSGGTTSLYDALVTVLAAYPVTDRPHMIFAVTDGRDNSSFVTASHVVDVARTSSAMLCLALVASSNPLVREGGTVDAVDPMTTEQSTVTLPGLGVSMPRGSAQVGTTTAISRSVGPYRGGPNTAALREAAAATGGLLYPDSSRTPVPQLFRRVLDDFRAAYVLTYTPTGVDRVGRHAITVRTKNRSYTVRARKSYDQR